MPRRSIRGKINPVDPHLPVSRDGWVGPDVSSSVGPVLARWTYGPGEWAAYTRHVYGVERGGAWVGAWVVGAALALLAFWFAVKNVSRPVLALLVAAAFVVGVTGTRLSLARSRRRNLALARPTTVIGINGVLAAGQKAVVCNETMRVSRVTYLTLQEQPELEFTFSYPGRGADSHYTMRVLIPRGHEEEAVELVDRFTEGRWYDHALPAGAG